MSRSNLLASEFGTQTTQLDADSGQSLEGYSFEGVFSADLCADVAANSAYRRVLFTTDNTQLVIMCVSPEDKEIEAETHATTAQTFFVVSGAGQLIYNAPGVGVGTVHLTRGITAIVPAGTRHRIINDLKTESLRLFTLYSQPQHAVDLVQRTRSDPDRKFTAPE